MHTPGSSGDHDTLPSRWLFLHRPSWGPLALISSSSGPGSVGSQPVSATLLHCDEVLEKFISTGANPAVRTPASVSSVQDLCSPKSPSKDI